MNYLIAYLGTGIVFAVWMLASFRATVWRARKELWRLSVYETFLNSPRISAQLEWARERVLEMRKQYLELSAEVDELEKDIKKDELFTTVTAITLWPIHLLVITYATILHSKSSRSRTGKKRV